MCATFKFVVSQGVAVSHFGLRHHHPPIKGVVWCRSAARSECGVAVQGVAGMIC